MAGFHKIRNGSATVGDCSLASSPIIVHLYPSTCFHKIARVAEDRRWSVDGSLDISGVEEGD